MGVVPQGKQRSAYELRRDRLLGIRTFCVGDDLAGSGIGALGRILGGQVDFEVCAQLGILHVGVTVGDA